MEVAQWLWNGLVDLLNGWARGSTSWSRAGSWEAAGHTSGIPPGMPPAPWYSLVMMGLHTFSSSFCWCSNSSFSAVWFIHRCQGHWVCQSKLRKVIKETLNWQMSQLIANLPGSCQANWWLHCTCQGSSACPHHWSCPLVSHPQQLTSCWRNRIPDHLGRHLVALHIILTLVLLCLLHHALNVLLAETTWNGLPVNLWSGCHKVIKY